MEIADVIGVVAFSAALATYATLVIVALVQVWRRGLSSISKVVWTIALVGLPAIAIAVWYSAGDLTSNAESRSMRAVARLRILGSNLAQGR